MIEWIKEILLYSEDKPLLFTQFYFWAFFAVILVIYSIIYKNRAVRNAWLFFASIFFYYKTSGFFFFILLFSTLADFILGKAIFKAEKPINKKWFVAISVFINIFILAYFKYTHFFVDNINDFLGTSGSVSS